MARAPQSRPRRRRSVRPPAPPFCPNARCRAHATDARSRGWRPIRRGRRAIARPPGEVFRFTCPWCRRSFSSSVFGPDYRCRIAGLDGRLFHLLCEGQAERQAARSLGVSHGAVRRRRRRMARQALLFHLELLARVPWERIVRVELDGFRTFAMSQYEPLDLNTLLEGETSFVLDIDPAPLRRSGRMTERQRARRAERDARLGGPPRRARERSVARLVDRLLARRPAGLPLCVASDEEPSYRIALGAAGQRCPVRHETVSSKVRRDVAGHPLWRTNHLHRLLRHGRADHKRETLSFAKRLQGLLDRGWLSVVWRNVTKGISERRAEDAGRTPAMLLGLLDRPLSGEEIFRERRFPKLVELPPAYRAFYEGRVKARPRERIAA